MLPIRTRVTQESFPSVLGTTSPHRAERRQTLTELALRSSPAGGASAFAAHTITPTTVAITHVYAVLSEASKRAGLTAAGACEAGHTLTPAKKDKELQKGRKSIVWSRQPEKLMYRPSSDVVAGGSVEAAACVAATYTKPS